MGTIAAPDPENKPGILVAGGLFACSGFLMGLLLGWLIWA